MSRLPRPLTELVGRERDFQEVEAALATSRLVTLTGVGGVGKTRLAIRVAEALAGAYTDGAWFVDLASLASPSLVPQRVATALGVREVRGQPLLETLAASLRDKQLLLVLDNCEQLLRECASLRVLATSRQPLGPTGERLDLLAEVWGVQGQPDRAARLLGAAEALRDAMGAWLWPDQRSPHARIVAAIRAALGEKAFVSAWAEGRAMTEAAAVAYALEC